MRETAGILLLIALGCSSATGGMGSPGTGGGAGGTGGAGGQGTPGGAGGRAGGGGAGGAAGVGGAGATGGAGGSAGAGGACPSDGSPCANDSHCIGGSCVPFRDGESAPGCQRRSAPAGLIAPQTHCEWLGPPAGDAYPMHKQVLTTPVVADLDLDGHRSNVDNLTTRPSIVFPSYDGTDGACGLGPMGDATNFGVLRIMDGRTCLQQHTIPVPVNGSATPALGDLDGDGRAEIVTLDSLGGVVAFRYEPTMMTWRELWRSHTAAGAPSRPVAGKCMWTGVSLHDLDDDGRPEVLVEGWVYGPDGALIDGTAGALHGTASGEFPIVADVDGDGAPDLVAASGRWRWDAAMRRLVRAATFTGMPGHVAVADFGTFGATAAGDDRTRLDGKAEIAVVGSGQARIMTLDGRVVFGPIMLPGSTGGGPPTIGDFDGDGLPELAVAGSDSYNIFDPDCTGTAPDATRCGTGRTDGILWTAASQDHSSNITGSSVFDFEGNGTAEAVYADECFVRIMAGKTGDVLFSQQHSSCTWLENPVVADVEGNFRSKLIVPSNQNCTVSCPAIDASFAGLRCQAATDCPAGLPCQMGLCRCTADAECNGASGGDFACAAPPMGTPGTGNTCRAAHTGSRTGVRVFGDVLDRWVASRAIWNQHAYSVTNVRDDGRIPRTSQWVRNWTAPGLNDFRQNVQGSLAPEAAPDLTGRGDPQCPRDGRVMATVCNRGTGPSGDGVRVRFVDTAGGTLCEGVTVRALGPGQCADVMCDTSSRPATGDVRVEIDPGASVSECEEANNVVVLPIRCVG